MKLHTDEFYYSAIKNAFPNSWNIRVPAVAGLVSPVFICDTPTGPKVCRFSEYDIVFRNRYVSNLLTLNDIPVPRTDIRAYMDSWFEVYDYCPSQTLYERVNAGMTDTEIFNTYKRVIDIQRQISDISPIDFRPGRCKHMSEVFFVTQCMRLPTILSQLYTSVHKLFSTRGKMYVLHNDLNSRNVLVDDNGHVSRLIDLDAVALCNESFSVLMSLRMYPLDNCAQYLDYYEDTMGRKLNRSAILDGLKIMSAIRARQIALNRLLWRGYNPPPEH